MPTRSPVAGLRTTWGTGWGTRSGVGAGWRPAIADELLRQTRTGQISFSEVVAENLRPGTLPTTLVDALDAGLTIVPHGVGLGLAAACPPDSAGVLHLAELALATGAPLVSEHVAFVRAGSPPDHIEALHGDVFGAVIEAGHLVPPPPYA